jgi:hypothetical protein
MELIKSLNREDFAWLTAEAESLIQQIKKNEHIDDEMYRGGVMYGIYALWNVMTQFNDDGEVRDAEIEKKMYGLTIEQHRSK